MLISVDKMPRGKWPLARIIETYPGKDNLIGTVLLQTAKGQLKRPIPRCCKLELADHGDVNPTIIKSDVVLHTGDQGGEDVVTPNQVRPGCPTCSQARQILNYHVTMRKHASTRCMFC